MTIYACNNYQGKKEVMNLKEGKDRNKGWFGLREGKGETVWL